MNGGSDSHQTRKMPYTWLSKFCQIEHRLFRRFGDYPAWPILPAVVSAKQAAISQQPHHATNISCAVLFGHKISQIHNRNSMYSS